MKKVLAIFFLISTFIYPQLEPIEFQSSENIKKFADYLFCEGDYLRAVEEYETIRNVVKNDTIDFKMMLCYSKIGLYEEAEKNLEEHKSLLEKGRRESAEIIDQAKERTGKLQNEMLEKADKEAQKLLEKAKNDIALEREKALEEIKLKVADISVALAEKMISKSITPDEHRELINNSIKELE